MEREIKFRFWDPYQKEMIYNGYDHADMSFNGLLVCEGDTIPLQYTGLKDKNGREIYEGDILRQKSVFELIGVATWSESYAGWEIVWQDNELRYTRGYGAAQSWATCEVIDNIYENPELLAEPTK